MIDLTAHGGGTIRIENTNVADLDAEDFRIGLAGDEPPTDFGAGIDGL